MRRFRLLALGLLLAAGAALAGADPAPSPLRLIPAEADLVLQLHSPGRLIEVVTSLDALKGLGNLAAVKEQLDSTQGRRTRQLLAYFEKSLGMKWREAVTHLAAGGAAAGVKVGGDGPAVLVVQGDDEKLAEKFLATAVEVLQGELTRQESKEKVEKGDYNGVAGYKVGPLFFARVGAALIAANKKEAMAAALDLHLGKGKKSMADHPGLREAAALLPEEPLASAWLNMAPVQKAPQAKALYKSPRDDGTLTVLFGGYLDLLGRTPFLCGALCEDREGLLLTARMPRGTDGMGPDRELHVGPAEGAGAKPLLEPKGVLYSSQFYLDLSRIWTDREKLFPKKQADSIANNDKNSGRFLAGVKLSTLLESVGGRHRLVVTRQEKRPYQREPQIRLPAFALVAELRQPEKFARAVDTILRTVALLATGTFKMELAEEKYGEYDLVAYRFDEKAEVKEDTNDLRYNFSPCFARVKDQFLFCSTTDLCKALIDQLAAEEKSPPKGDGVTSRDRFYAEGFAGLLRSFEEQLLAQTILDRAVPPAEAKKQVDEAIAFVRGLGGLRSEVRFEPKRFRYDIRLKLKK